MFSARAWPVRRQLRNWKSGCANYASAVFCTWFVQPLHASNRFLPPSDRLRKPLKSSGTRPGTRTKLLSSRPLRRDTAQYREEMAELRGLTKQARSPDDWIDLAESHPINRVVDPCEELVRLNREKTNRTLVESERVSVQAHWAMLLLGLFGPLGGIAMGYGAARGLSRSIYRLSVRVQDVAQRLDRDVGIRERRRRRQHPEARPATPVHHPSGGRGGRIVSATSSKS